MNETGIRWRQRFENYEKALNKLTEAVELFQNNRYSEETEDIFKEGLIQRFEYTFELAWKVMKDYAEYQGNPDIGGSRDAIREAYAWKLIEAGTVWMQMIKSRNRTSHTYNQDTADAIFAEIIRDYYPEFKKFQKEISRIAAENFGDFA
jgi:nucleotidyltransferase substrate binding protein (TIGR01987 family)